MCLSSCVSLGGGIAGAMSGFHLLQLELLVFEQLEVVVRVRTEKDRADTQEIIG